MNLKIEAVNYFSQYRRSYEEWTKCVERIKLLREKQMAAGSPNLSGMPKAGGNIDLSDYVVRLEMQITDCRAKQDKAREEMRKVKEIIEDVYDNTDRAILSYRYIDFLQFSDIADKLGISKATVTRRHENAVIRAIQHNNDYGRYIE